MSTEKSFSDLTMDHMQCHYFIPVCIVGFHFADFYIAIMYVLFYSLLIY